MNNGQWTMDNEQWTMDNEQWTMDNEQWTILDKLLKQHTNENIKQLLSSNCIAWRGTIRCL
ncbi:hypothetical protein FACS189467_1310 [Bacteroidia bacterium]|nr:hypothetical protein FACS189467_1310 [Bacteroidia bacterium]